MSEHTPTPWITRDGMICRGGYAPHTRSTLKADAELIVKAVNSHDALVEFVRDLLDAEDGRSLNDGGVVLNADVRTEALRLLLADQQ